MRHKHADLIHAWAEGAEIEIFNCGQWVVVQHPTFSGSLEYRIKPTPKPDVVKLYYKVGEMFSECLEGEGCTHKHVLCCAFDGETGELKYSEVIK
jgi:hypothetical protein